MNKEIANINKILEIDIDTEKVGGPTILIRQVASVMYNRERQPDNEEDIRDNMVILVNALGATILKAEKDGICKPGEAMTRVTELLMDLYVDASAEVVNIQFDQQGNKV